MGPPSRKDGPIINQGSHHFRLSPPFPSLLLSLPSLTLEVEPLKSSCQICGQQWATTVESGAEPQMKPNLVPFCLKIRQLTATILIIFLRINWPNLVQLKQWRQTGTKMGDTDHQWAIIDFARVTKLNWDITGSMHATSNKHSTLHMLQIDNF